MDPNTQLDMFPLSGKDIAAMSNEDLFARLEPSSTPDNIHLPNHYARFKIEPIRFIVENKLDWFQGNIVKYSLRYDAKNGMEDLRKAARYNEMQRKYLAGDPDWWR